MEGVLGGGSQWTDSSHMLRWNLNLGAKLHLSGVTPFNVYKHTLLFIPAGSVVYQKTQPLRVAREKGDL